MVFPKALPDEMVGTLADALSAKRALQIIEALRRFALAGELGDGDASHGTCDLAKDVSRDLKSDALNSLV